MEGARSDGAEGKCEEEQGHNAGVKPVAVAMDTAIAALLIILGVKKTKKRRDSEIFLRKRQRAEQRAT